MRTLPSGKSVAECPDLALVILPVSEKEPLEAAGLMPIEAVADLVGSRIEVATIVTAAGFGTETGAVKRPELSTVPHGEMEQPAPVIDQVTLVDVPGGWAVAESWSRAPAGTVAVEGEIDSCVGAVDVWPVDTGWVMRLSVPPHAANVAMNADIANLAIP